MASSASAQSIQQRKVDSVFEQVKKYFNQKNSDAIYNMAGADFQKELNIDAFAQVTQKQLFSLGKIRESSLVSFVNNNVATYKLKLDSITLQLLMSLDKHDKLELFLFQEYQEPIGNKTALVQTSNPLRTAMDKQVDSVARIYIQKSTTVGLSIGIIKDGKTTIYQYGETIRGYKKLPNEDNFFEIGSITKTFTATLLAYYVNQGKIKLTDPITKFLPDSVVANPALKGITLVQLSNHTSGLPRLPDNLIEHATDALNPYKDYTAPFMYAYLKNCKLNSKPGEQYLYSNLGVGLLGSILETISSLPFNQMVHDIITQPLNMQSTSQFLNPLLLPRFLAEYNAGGQATPAWDFDVLAPCGALRSTLSDLLIYTKANMHPGNEELSKAMILTHKITFNKDVKIGLAWHIITVNGVDYIFHNGGTNGSSSFLAFNADKNIGIVVLSNAAESTDAVGSGILKEIQ
ncbi:CubicO group peptidase (beta-lactamase class C family) [Mucilaginibacter frigoritolerans]|uniref:CubicO group peptidase (Beta-lactamase class C family) n=2 Tax=Mucilaginibacter frigoritolerans TaxID=652788 RepID=A0A562UAE6_9SPHI|nr:CubicO group peptidase (beta-lactamase class C family) [Mucilaginibacter frigoritolerans]